MGLVYWDGAALRLGTSVSMLPAGLEPETRKVIERSLRALVDEVAEANRQAKSGATLQDV